MTQSKNRSLKAKQLGFCGFLGLLLLAFSGTAKPHDLNVTGVARIFLDEGSNGNYRLSVADQQVPPLFNIERILPTRCEGLPSSQYSYRFRCAPELNGEDLITFPWRFQGVVVLAKWEDESTFSTYFPSSAGQIQVPLSQLQAGSASLLGIATRYFVIGTEHILFGIDHLLFLLGLLLLLQGFRMLVATITAFTVAHSITLGTAILGIFPLPTPPIEALIALSIVFLAREILRGQQGIKTLTHSKPWLAAFGFGLIHGFGFAAALGELGLATRDIPLALLFFNLGVEAGQLGFVCALLVLAGLFKKYKQEWAKPAEVSIAYGLGGIALFWFAERLPYVILT